MLVFDILELNGADVRALPLVERKEKLARLLSRTKDSTLVFVPAFDDAERLLQVVEEMGLEGIVSKRKDLSYRSGTPTDWIKTKAVAWREANKKRGRLFEQG